MSSNNLSINQNSQRSWSDFPAAVFSEAKSLIIPTLVTAGIFGGMHQLFEWGGIISLLTPSPAGSSLPKTRLTRFIPKMLSLRAPKLLCSCGPGMLIPKDGSWTPKMSALYFGLMPAVNKAVLAIFKSHIKNPEQETKQIKAQMLIATTLAGFCTPICATVVYNIFASALDWKQWSAGTVAYNQISTMIIIAGIGTITNQACKTILAAKGLSDDEIQDFQSQMAKNNAFLSPKSSEEVQPENK